MKRYIVKYLRGKRIFIVKAWDTDHAIRKVAHETFADGFKDDNGQMVFYMLDMFTAELLQFRRGINVVELHYESRQLGHIQDY